jgi:YHS domain-containing protein
VQGPEIWLNQLGVEVPCVVAPEQMAVLDEAHRVFVNYETYYLSSLEAKQAFAHEPWRFTGLVTDPVSTVRFQPAPSSPTVSQAGRLFYFSSPETAKAFADDPVAYATPVVPYAGHM